MEYIFIVFIGLAFFAGFFIGGLYVSKKFNSNERKTVRKHEGKKKICPICNGTGIVKHPKGLGVDLECVCRYRQI